MALRRKKRPGFEAPDLLAIAHRVKGLDNPQILEHLDLTAATIGQYLQGYHSSRDELYLKELALSAQAVYVMAEEMLTRMGQPGSIVKEVPPARQVKSARPY